MGVRQVSPESTKTQFNITKTWRPKHELAFGCSTPNGCGSNHSRIYQRPKRLLPQPCGATTWCTPISRMSPLFTVRWLIKKIGELRFKARIYIYFSKYFFY